MFLKKYLSEYNYNLLLESYNWNYLETLNEVNFLKIYTLFQQHQIDCMEDLIVDFLELFQWDERVLKGKLEQLEKEYNNHLSEAVENNLAIIGNILYDDYSDSKEELESL